MDSKVKKKTGHGIYMEHLVKWNEKRKYEATWIVESGLKKREIPTKLLQVDPP